MKLTIDPGHGGKRNGIVRGDLVEKDVNLQLAKHLALSCHGLTVEPTLTRYDDKTLAIKWRADLDERGAIAEASGADLTISIHVNGHSSRPDLHGAECYIWPGDTVARRISEVILDAMPECLRTTRIREATDKPDPSDDWLQRPRSVLAPHVQRGIRAVLVECGYATNDHDREYLLTKWGRAAVVCALRAGIVEAGRLLEEIRP